MFLRTHVPQQKLNAQQSKKISFRTMTLETAYLKNDRWLTFYITFF